MTQGPLHHFMAILLDPREALDYLKQYWDLTPKLEKLFEGFIANGVWTTDAIRDYWMMSDGPNAPPGTPRESPTTFFLKRYDLVPTNNPIHKLFDYWSFDEMDFRADYSIQAVKDSMPILATHYTCQRLNSTWDQPGDSVVYRDFDDLHSEEYNIEWPTSRKTLAIIMLVRKKHFRQKSIGLLPSICVPTFYRLLSTPILSHFHTAGLNCDCCWDDESDSETELEPPQLAY